MNSLKNKPTQNNPNKTGKQNNHKSQKNLTPNPERIFGKDITKQHMNAKYNFLVPIKQKTIKLPSFLRQKETLEPALRPYENTILQHIINSHDEYDLTKKSKNVLMRGVKRAKIVEYFCTMCCRFKLKKKTLFLCTYIYDKYMEKNPCTLTADHVCLAGSCLLIAMKYEEIYPPFLKDWCDRPEEVIKLEARVLKALDFKLIYTTGQHYLELYESKSPNKPREQRVLYQCLLELYLITGHIYDDHPLRIVQIITDCFRPTLFMENDSHYHQANKKVTAFVLKNKNLWEKIVQINDKYYSK